MPDDSTAVRSLSGQLGEITPVQPTGFPLQGATAAVDQGPRSLAA